MGLALLLCSCGKSTSHPDGEFLARIQETIDHRNYEGAIEQLQGNLRSHPQNSDAKKKLLHALAGAAGFESGPVFFKASRIARTAVRINLENLNLKKFSKITYRLLSPLGTPTYHQLLRLTQAINLLQLLERKRLIGRYEYFKWGTLHAYRLAHGIRDFSDFLHQEITQGRVISLRTLEEYSLPRLIDMTVDLFMVYRLYNESFPVLRSATVYLDRVLEHLLKQQNFRLKVNSQAESREEFFLSLLRDNSKLGPGVLRLIAETAEGRKLPAAVTSLFKVCINLVLEDEVVDDRLQRILTPRLKDEVHHTFRQILEERSLSSLEKLLASDLEEIRILRSSYTVLAEKLSVGELPSGVRGEVREFLEALEGSTKP